MGVERAKHRAFGRSWWLWVVDAVDKEREAEDIGEQNELLSVCDKRSQSRVTQLLISNGNHLHGARRC